MKIYIVQDLKWSWYEMLYAGTDIDKANQYLLNSNSKYIEGSLWENGEEIANNLKTFNKS